MKAAGVDLRTGSSSPAEIEAVEEAGISPSPSFSASEEEGVSRSAEVS